MYLHVCFSSTSQNTKLKPPTEYVTVNDDELHYGRCVSIDKQTQDTSAISCAGCDPGNFKTALISDAADGIGSQGRGAVFIYKGSEKSGFRQWTATQMLWPRHNKWFYFGSAFLTIDGNTLVTDACKGARCTYNDFVNREYDSPMTDLFIYVKQEATGLWSEQQVLTDPVMETNFHSKEFAYVELHDDTIAIGISLTYFNRDNKLIKNINGLAGQVLIFYPNLPNYEITETFRHKAGVKSREEDSNSYRLNQHQWSLQQFLTAEDDGSDKYTYYGKYVSISGDRMAIGMRGVSTGNRHGGSILYTRQRQGGLWSQQQMLVDYSEATAETYGIDLYNSYFVQTGGKRFYKYMSEQAHGKWSCLLVSMFDEFGDGWDGAKLRVDAPDGSYDYYYPTCDVPTASQLDLYQNPFQFQYCPSVKEQGGMYKFYIVDAEGAKFNWEVEWSIDMNLVKWRKGINDLWGNSTDRYVGDIHTHMEFYWNPITLSFEKGPSYGELPQTVSCTSCAVQDHTHRNLLTEHGTGDDTSRSLRHVARTASPTVSPAPTMLQADSALAEWEKLIMTTSDPLRPWFRADRTGTYFFLSDLDGKKLLRKDTQCFGSSTPLSHSCWLNYPETIPDGDYIARIGGARAGINAGLHTWHFCGVDGAQSEHLQFRVQHGSCYPVQRFTTTRYCTFKQGSTVIVDLPASFGVTLDYLTPKQEANIVKVLAQLLPNTKESDFSITNQELDDTNHLHATVHVKLRVSEHGLDPSDFDAVSKLEATFSSYMYKISSNGELSSALSSVLGSSSKEDISVDFVAFDTAVVPSRTIGMVDDDAPVVRPSEEIDKDWMQYHPPASQLDRNVVTVASAITDVISVLGYIGLVICFAYGAKQARTKYLESKPTLQRDLDSATETLLHAKVQAVSSGDRLVRKVHGSLDSFSNNIYAIMTEKNQTKAQQAIPEVVIPPLDTVYAMDDSSSSSSNRKKERTKTSNTSANRKDMYSSETSSDDSNSPTSTSDKDEESWENSHFKSKRNSTSQRSFRG